MTVAPSILIASPSTACRALLQEHFSARGYQCLEASSPNELISQCETGPQALILDLSGKDSAWGDRLSDIQQPPAFARIFLYRDTPAPSGSSLRLPLRISALEQALARALRPMQSAIAGSPLLIWPNIALQVSEKILVRQSDSEQVDLTEKECDMLLRLLAAEGESIAKEQLLREVWHYGEDIDTHTLETHIYRLRNKIKRLTGDDGMILNEMGGYSLKKG